MEDRSINRPAITAASEPSRPAASERQLTGGAGLGGGDNLEQDGNVRSRRGECSYHSMTSCFRAINICNGRDDEDLTERLEDKYWRSFRFITERSQEYNSSARAAVVHDRALHWPSTETLTPQLT
ncbi:hypothetical protein DPEC_G00137600 [Dallia pectoralis]|uniref:Uncharacterized protein n=1 Tax=Dallia pectoralis TaxID=75939 RepID=A0ACC2GM84_DALPE|nr:hypothetical protein DPEC_G00137600 [Dallia pectoralis]